MRRLVFNFPLAGLCVVLCCCAVMIAWVLQSAHIIGINNMEATTVVEALDGVESFAQGNFFKALGPEQWMRYDYAGQVKELMLWPFLLFLGPVGVALTRFIWAVYACVTVLAVYYVMSTFFGVLSGILSACFLALNAQWIAAVRHDGMREEPLMLFFLWLSLGCYTLFFKTHKRVFLKMVFLLWGIGLWAKLMFAGYIIGFAVLGILFNSDAQSIFKSKKRFFSACGMFFVGSFPFWIGNLLTDYPTFRVMYDALWGYSCYENKNWAVAYNLLIRIKHFGELLWGDFSGFFGGDWILNGAWILLFCYAVVYFVWRFFKVKDTVSQRIMYITVFYSVVLVMSVFVPAGRYAEQLIVLFPFPQIICGVFIAQVFRSSKFWVITVMLFVCVFHLGLQQYLLVQTDSMAKSNGLAGEFSSQVIDCSNYLVGNGIYQPVRFSDGLFYPQIRFLSKNRIQTFYPSRITPRQDKENDVEYYNRLFEKHFRGVAHFTALIVVPEENVDVYRDVLKANQYRARKMKTFEGSYPISIYRVSKID